jgi:hypothetical protein
MYEAADRGPDVYAPWDPISRWALVVAGVLACVLASGWILGIAWMTSIVPGAAQSSPTAVFALLLLLLAAVTARRAAPRPARVVEVTAGAAVGLLVLSSFSSSFGGPDLGIEGLVGGATRAADIDPTVALTSGLGLLLLAIFHLIPVADAEHWKRRFAAAGLAIASSVVPLLGHLYDAQQLIQPLGLRATSPAMSVAVLCLGISAAATSLPERWWRLLTSPRPAGLIVRRLLPLSLLALAVIGYPRLLGERLGLYDLGVGTSLMVIANGVVIGLIVVRTAMKLEIEQRRADTEARAALEYQSMLGRQAIELNDEVIQALSAAWLALQLDQQQTAAAEIKRATDQAQRIASEQLQASGRNASDLSPILTRTSASGGTLRPLP